MPCISWPEAVPASTAKANSASRAAALTWRELPRRQRSRNRPARSSLVPADRWAPRRYRLRRARPACGGHYRRQLLLVRARSSRRRAPESFSASRKTLVLVTSARPVQSACCWVTASLRSVSTEASSGLMRASAFCRRELVSAGAQAAPLRAPGVSATQRPPLPGRGLQTLRLLRSSSWTGLPPVGCC